MSHVVFFFVDRPGNTCFFHLVRNSDFFYQRLSKNYDGENLEASTQGMIETLSKARENFQKSYPPGTPRKTLSDFELLKFSDVIEKVEKELISLVSPLKTFVGSHKSQALYLASLLKGAITLCQARATLEHSVEWFMNLAKLEGKVHEFLRESRATLSFFSVAIGLDLELLALIHKYCPAKVTLARKYSLVNRGGKGELQG